MTQLRPPMPMMPPTATNPAARLPTNSIIAAGPTPTKPLFPSGATETNNNVNSSSNITTMASAASAISNLSATNSGSLPGNRPKIEPVYGNAKIIHPDEDISLEEFRASLPKYKQIMMPQQIQMPPMPAGFSMANFMPPPMAGLQFMAPPPGFPPMGFNGPHY